MDALSLLNPGESPDYITNENYYLYKQDIERIASMGIKYYRFLDPVVTCVAFRAPRHTGQ